MYVKESVYRGYYKSDNFVFRSSQYYTRRTNDFWFLSSVVDFIITIIAIN